MSLFGSWIGRVLGDLIGRFADLNELEPPPASCPISWQPSVTAPVFYGTRDYGPPTFSMFRIGLPPVTRWPPGTFRVFFPSLGGSPQYGAMLEPCGRYPLIMFLHGQCTADAPYNYTKWYELPAELARSGYVVVVPHLPHTGKDSQAPGPQHPDIPLVLAIMRWMRTDWEYARVLLPNPATGIVGHSHGALLGGQIALGQQLLAAQGQQAIPISAYTSLSGVWHELDMPWPISQLNTPKLFTFGTNEFDTDVVNPGVWNSIPSPKHSAVFQGGEHWDYLPRGRSACGAIRGQCELVGLICRDIVPAFFGKYLPPERWPTLPNVIPDNLIATLDMPDSPEREFYAGSHLMGMSLLDTSTGTGCSVTLAWNTSGAGEETHP